MPSIVAQLACRLPMLGRGLSGSASAASWPPLLPPLPPPPLPPLPPPATLARLHSWMRDAVTCAESGSPSARSVEFFRLHRSVKEETMLEWTAGTWRDLDAAP